MASRVPVQVQDQNSELHIKGANQMLSTKTRQKSGQVVRKPLSDLTNVGKSLTTHASKTNQPKRKTSKAVVVNKKGKSNFLNEPTECFHFTGTDMEHYQKKMREKDVEKKVQEVVSSFKPRLHIPWPDLYQNESSPERKYLPEMKLEWWGDSPSLRSPLKPAEDDPILDDQDDWLQLALKESPVISWRRPPL
ncbi:uncharacterized protein LOC116248720 [Nymphaea colorata]|nr:uncharacterized protein LOC116248720 [Nymphaea colorata]